MKKNLGQNFLMNKNFVRKIIEAANVNKNDVVLEVGPGKGILTEELVKKAGRVIAVEKDKELADFLMDKFKGQDNLSIINDDVLKINPDALRGRSSDRKRRRNYNYKIVANIPYYITSHFLRMFLQSNCQPSLMALMVQKEVAERIVAKDGKESLLSISVKSYGKPRIIANVPAGNFFPKPKVNSAIFLINHISRDFFVKNGVNEKKFFELVRAGFSHKRKLLKNNLSSFVQFVQHSVLDIGVLDIGKFFQKCGILALARPEELSLENWKCLFMAINKRYSRTDLG